MFLKYFLPVCVYLSILLPVSFAKQKFLILIEANVSVFSFMDGAFGVVSKKSLPNSKSPRFSSVLPSRSFHSFVIYATGLCFEVECF